MEHKELEGLRFLDSIIESIPHMIFIKDAKDLRFIRFNKAGEELLGYSRKEMIGKNDYDFFPPPQADFFTSKDRLVLQGKKLVDIPEESIHTRKKGTRILHTKKIPILDEGGVPRYLLGISEDITDKRDTEQRFQSLVGNIPGVVYRCACDKDWTMHYVSDAIFDVCGYPAVDFMNGVRTYAGIIHPDDRRIVEETVLESVKKHEPFVLEYRVVTRDGKIRWVYEKGRGVFDGEGKLRWLDGALLDVTDHKKVQSELAKFQAEKEQLEIFTYLASHDLQEPLQKIISFSELLKAQAGPQLDQKGRDYLERMQNSARRMTQLVQDLLNLSRVLTKQPNFELVNLKKVLQDVLSDLEVRLRKSGARIESDALSVVRADRLQMYQLFQNLLSNAVKFRKKGETPNVSITSRLDGDFVEIRFQDNGIGFNEKDLERIFRPFERLHSWSEYEGTGIGLAICQKIVSRHGGRITAESAPGKGSTFIVTLPFSESAARPSALAVTREK